MNDVERSCRQVMDGLDGLTPDDIKAALVDEEKADRLARQLEDMYMDIDGVIGEIAIAEKDKEGNA
mgnify:CR=1 FL=1